METRLHALLAEIQACIAELVAANASMQPYLEGYRDLESLNIGGASKEDVQELRADDEHRVSLITTTNAAAEQLRTATEALLADGYPELGKKSVTQGVLEDLVDQRRTISAALTRFEAQASALNLTVGPERPTA